MYINYKLILTIFALNEQLPILKTDLCLNKVVNSQSSFYSIAKHAKYC